MPLLHRLDQVDQKHSKSWKSLTFVAFDQLNRDSHLFQDFSESAKSSSVFLFVESDQTLRERAWHFQRAFFLVSSARHFAAELVAAGENVLYIKAANFDDAFTEIREKFPHLELKAMAPASFGLRNTLLKHGFTLIKNDLFLNSPEEFAEWASGKKTLLMENFYRQQRRLRNILMDGEKPLGGQWNFDHENRLPPPKNHRWPSYLDHKRDEIDEEVITELASRYPQLWGEQPDQTWATTRKGALGQMRHFFEHHFANFGAYEDAMPENQESWQVHHSLLSPYLNNGLLHPREVIEAAIKRFEKGDIPIASCEGFIRQIIGWREYVYGIYWLFGEKYRRENQLKAGRKLLPLYREPERTEMACVRDIVSATRERAWVHHIPRLMVLSNLALITGVQPEEFLDWMSEVFIDAYDWVMVPNVIGMGVHADGGAMMTKPYAAGGAYISRMSNYCKGCKFDPKLRTGESACPFTTLYWDFLDRNREVFAKNHRMAQQVRGIDRLSDLDQLRERALEVLEGLSKGEI